MQTRRRFLPLPISEVALCPVVDGAHWIERLLPCGIDLIQLRLKSRPDADAAVEIRRSAELARRYKARIIINSNWDLAIRHRAYGVHLGREAWETADLNAIAHAGLVLGMSVHSDKEVVQALAFEPSYLLIGTVFPSPSKSSPHRSLGIDEFRRLAAMSSVPTVAIGGITMENAASVFEAGAAAVAVVSDLTQSPDPAARVKAWRQCFVASSSPRRGPVLFCSSNRPTSEAV